MRIRTDRNSIPYPLIMLRGKLRLVGLSFERIENIISDLVSKNVKIDGQFTEEEMLFRVSKMLQALGSESVRKFEMLMEYSYLRRSNSSIDPIVLVLEGASGTGKSMLALNMIQNIGATRIISTDTIRQVLRSTSNIEDNPELFCHTYQAHEKKQSGPESLDKIIRGYLAQMELISPVVEAMVQRVLVEGADAVIEGVHAIPGMLSKLSDGVIEILINPDSDTHKEMFMSKGQSTGLKSVSLDIEQRKSEYEAARAIQEYMVDMAHENNVKIIDLDSYEKAEEQICEIVIDAIHRIIQDSQ